MAKKIICDGCDKDITDQRLLTSRQEIIVSVNRGSKADDAKSEVYDLCSSCNVLFDRYVDPRQWVRHG